LLKSQNGDSWSAYYEHTRPFADEEMAEGQKIANEMMASFHGQNYTSRLMFAKVNKNLNSGKIVLSVTLQVYRFMKYLGFERLPRNFWTNSIFTRNWAKDMICHPATAYDMVQQWAINRMISITFSS
jgi:hypothetical protein